ncbi:hypothetical protein ONZ45_g16262 [Pleurotus djamor]|nr:hypothetical protein ONZ45_g16262 [Pleurotus djamor]
MSDSPPSDHSSPSLVGTLEESSPLLPTPTPAGDLQTAFTFAGSHSNDATAEAPPVYRFTWPQQNPPTARRARSQNPDSVRAKLNSLRAHVASLRDGLNASQVAYVELVDATTRALDEANRSKDQTEETLNALLNELTETQGLYDQMNEMTVRNASLKDQVKDLQKSDDMRRAEVDMLRDENDTMHESIFSMTEQIDSLNLKIKRLERDLEESDSLRPKLKRLDEELQEYSDYCSVVVKQLCASTIDLESSKSHVSQLSDENARLKEELANTRITIDALSHRPMASERDLDYNVYELIDENVQLKKELADARIAIDALSQSLAVSKEHVNDNVSQVSDENVQLKKELADARITIDALSQSLAVSKEHVNDNVSQLSGENAQLRKALAEANKTNDKITRGAHIMREDLKITQQKQLVEGSKRLKKYQDLVKHYHNQYMRADAKAKLADTQANSLEVAAIAGSRALVPDDNPSASHAALEPLGEHAKEKDLAKRVAMLENFIYGMMGGTPNYVADNDVDFVALVIYSVNITVDDYVTVVEGVHHPSILRMPPAFGDFFNINVLPVSGIDSWETTLERGSCVKVLQTATAYTCYFPLRGYSTGACEAEASVSFNNYEDFNTFCQLSGLRPVTTHVRYPLPHRMLLESLLLFALVIFPMINAVVSRWMEHCFASIAPAVEYV